MGKEREVFPSKEIFPAEMNYPRKGPNPDLTSWSFHWLRPSDRTFVFRLNFLGTFTQSPVHHTSLHLFIYVFIYLLISVIYILPEHCAWLLHTWMYFSFNSTTRSLITEMPSVVTTPFTVWTYSRYSVSACYISLCEIIPYTSAIVGGYGGGSPTIHPPKIGKRLTHFQKGNSTKFPRRQTIQRINNTGHVGLPKISSTFSCLLKANIKQVYIHFLWNCDCSGSSKTVVCSSLLLDLKMIIIKSQDYWDFPEVQWSRFCASKHRGHRFNPWLGN